MPAVRYALRMETSTPSTRSEVASDVPTQIFTRFIEALGPDVPAEVIACLKNTLLENRVLTDKSLRAAVLGDEAAP